MSLAAPLHVSVEEHLRLDGASAVRHEYIGGVRYAMTGPGVSIRVDDIYRGL